MNSEYGADESSEDEHYKYLRDLIFIISNKKIEREGPPTELSTVQQNGLSVRREVQNLIVDLESQSSNFKNNKRLATHFFLVNEVCNEASVLESVHQCNVSVLRVATQNVENSAECRLLGAGERLPGQLPGAPHSDQVSAGGARGDLGPGEVAAAERPGQIPRLQAARPSPPPVQVALRWTSLHLQHSQQ